MILFISDFHQFVIAVFVITNLAGAVIVDTGVAVADATELMTPTGSGGLEPLGEAGGGGALGVEPPAEI